MAEARLRPNLSWASAKRWQSAARMRQVSASPVGAARVAFSRRRSSLLLATASAVALLGPAPQAAALTCGGAPPADVATPAALYETLRDRTDAQLLAIGFAQQPADCAWVYEVKMLTTSGAVVELDFDGKSLDLIGARGPDNDKEVAQLVQGLGGDASTIATGSAKDGGRNPSGAGPGVSGSGSGSGSGSSGHGGGDDGGDDGGEGGDDGGEGSEGGEGGSSGSGGEGGEGGSGGEGGDGGGEGGGGEGGGGEGGDD